MKLVGQLVENCQDWVAPNADGKASAMRPGEVRVWAR
jgi:hypothetical protein